MFGVSNNGIYGAYLSMLNNRLIESYEKIVDNHIGIIPRPLN